MPEFDFIFDLSDIVAGGIRIVVIIGVTFILLWFLRRVIAKAITARIPKIREESPEQLALRSKTLSGVATGTVSFIA